MSSYRGLKTAIIPSGPMDNTDTITSQPINAASLEGIAFEPTWTGTPTGTLIVEVSLSYEPSPEPGGDPRNAGVWNNLGAQVSAQPSGSDGNTYIPVFASCTGWIRLSYTNASGSGVLGGTILGKTRG